MKKVLGFLLDFQRKHFDIRLYVSVGLFLAAALVFNYALDFENSYVDKSYKTFWHPVNMFLFQGIPFLAVCLILYFLNIKREWIRSKEFWLCFVIGFAILAMDRSFHYHEYLKPYFQNATDFYFIKKCVRWSSGLLVTVIPLLILSRFLQKEERNYFGLAWVKFDAKPYFAMLGIAVVIIGIASFYSELHTYYPRFINARGVTFAKSNDLPVWSAVALYELCYATDFLGVETLFRGFLIFAFARTLGGYAVLAMVSTYCVLHFGKPAPEAISSIFGGYILGVVSYNTRNVWGGVIIHIGVAWAMEVFGYLQRIF